MARERSSLRHKQIGDFKSIDMVNVLFITPPPAPAQLLAPVGVARDGGNAGRKVLG